MATFILINSIAGSTRQGLRPKYAGDVVDDQADDMAAIKKQGGALVPTSNAVAVASAAIAREVRHRGHYREAEEVVMAALIASVL